MTKKEQENRVFEMLGGLEAGLKALSKENADIKANSSKENAEIKDNIATHNTSIKIDISRLSDDVVKLKVKFARVAGVATLIFSGLTVAVTSYIAELL